MDKIIDITKILNKENIQDGAADKPKQREESNSACEQKHVTNPIYNKFVQFKNENLSKKFDIRDLFR